MTRVDPVLYEGKEVIPVRFLKSLLPDPASLAKDYYGKVVIGCLVTGKKDNKETTKFIYIVCDHAASNREIGAQAISYTTGVPAAIGAMLMIQGKWKGDGTFNVEQLDPDPFMENLRRYGLPWVAKDWTKLQ
jgi:saccharopine dehydrogenase (NAD+, L-lysine-forming)